MASLHTPTRRTVALALLQSETNGKGNHMFSTPHHQIISEKKIKNELSGYEVMPTRSSYICGLSR